MTLIVFTYFVPLVPTARDSLLFVLLRIRIGPNHETLKGQESRRILYSIT